MEKVGFLPAGRRSNVRDRKAGGQPPAGHALELGFHYGHTRTAASTVFR